MGLKQYSAAYCKHYNTPYPTCENEAVNPLLLYNVSRQMPEGLSPALSGGESE